MAGFYTGELHKELFIDTMNIFVFGSNEAGRHGAGAAKFAREGIGYPYYEYDGQIGNAYALPTKDAWIGTLPIEAISKYVLKFLNHAHANQQYTYYVTPIGCGLAGYKHEDIAPLFIKGLQLPNLVFCEEWKVIYESMYNGQKEMQG